MTTHNEWKSQNEKENIDKWLRIWYIRIIQFEYMHGHNERENKKL